jgi:hypothetical protein
MGNDEASAAPAAVFVNARLERFNRDISALPSIGILAADRLDRMRSTPLAREGMMTPDCQNAVSSAGHEVDI